MTRIGSVVLLGLAATFSRAGDVPRFGEHDLKQAHILAEEGDLHGAITLYFKILRLADNKDLRSDAREQLEHLGLSGQETFQMDPAALKPVDWDKLLSRLTTAAALRQRQELDLGYAEGLLRAAVGMCIDQAGNLKVEVQTKDLLRALDLMLQVAMAETQDEHVREAQSELERLGIAGPQVPALRKAVTDGKLSPELQSELVCGVCLQRLRKYREWLEERAEQEDEPPRKPLARRLGLSVYKYLAAQHAQSAAFKNPSDVLNFWRDMANAGQDKAF